MKNALYLICLCLLLIAPAIATAQCPGGNCPTENSYQGQPSTIPSMVPFGDPEEGVAPLPAQRPLPPAPPTTGYDNEPAQAMVPIVRPSTGITGPGKARYRYIGAPEGKYRAIVRLSVMRKNQQAPVQFGSGVFVRWNGRIYVLTADHIVRGAVPFTMADCFEQKRTAQLVIHDCDGRNHAGLVIYADRLYDFAICSTYLGDLGEVESVELERLSSPWSPGEPLEVCGLGQLGLMTGCEGNFTSYAQPCDRDGNVLRDPGAKDVDMFVCAGYARPGDSGGPVFAKNGRVVGVLTQHSPTTGRLRGAFGGRVFKAFADKLGPPRVSAINIPPVDPEPEIESAEADEAEAIMQPVIAKTSAPLVEKAAAVPDEPMEDTGLLNRSGDRKRLLPLRKRCQPTEAPEGESQPTVIVQSDPTISPKLDQLIVNTSPTVQPEPDQEPESEIKPGWLLVAALAAVAVALLIAKFRNLGRSR